MKVMADFQWKIRHCQLTGGSGYQSINIEHDLDGLQSCAKPVKF